MSYTNEQIQEIVATQRKYFRTGATLPIKWRIEQLKKLKAAVIAHAGEFEDDGECDSAGEEESE